MRSVHIMYTKQFFEQALKKIVARAGARGVTAIHQDGGSALLDNFFRRANSPRLTNQVLRLQ
ncbi:MAG TPA: hypothetical protein VGY98_20235 [Verrucomicrobiae bacterium]|nr:hypothetical protein [Verrucomicrobiae bacterium]